MNHSKKVLVICPYPENVAPSQRLKFEQYYPHFQAAGFQLTISPFISIPFWKVIYKPGHFFQKVEYTIGGYLRRLRDLVRVRQYDIVYIHLWATPFGPPIFERLFRLMAKRIVYDIDDLVYLDNVKSKAHPLVSLVKGRSKPIYLMKESDHIITCTPYLDSFVRKYNQQTTDISSTVDTEKYTPVNPYSNDKKLTLGWSGSLSTSKYFYLLADVLRELKQKHDFNILVIGDKDVKIDGLEINAVNWVEETEIENLQKIDIGLYPLPDEQWVYGKSGLKAIQYMALGIPTVATAIGANFRVIDDSESGFLVNTHEQWVDRLNDLLKDPDLRRTIGANARTKVEKAFSLKANAQRYIGILEAL